MAVYLNAASKPNGSSIDFYIGQPNSTTCAPSVTQRYMMVPTDVHVNQYDTLFVSDRNNNRILVFVNSSSITTSAPLADYVIGQDNFTSDGAGVGTEKLNWPMGLWYDSVYTGSLLVVDHANSRVLRYCSDASASVTASKTPSSTRTPSNTLSISMSNTGSMTNNFCEGKPLFYPCGPIEGCKHRNRCNGHGQCIQGGCKIILTPCITTEELGICDGHCNCIPILEDD